MKHLVLVLFLILSTAAPAQDLTCLNKLLHFKRHSGLHQLLKEEWNDGRNILDNQNAKAALMALIDGKLMCKTGELVIKVQPHCSQLLADLPQSNVCYVHTNLGYFFMSRDNGKNVNFIFSKDKRFSDSQL